MENQLIFTEKGWFKNASIYVRLVDLSEHLMIAFWINMITIFSLNLALSDESVTTSIKRGQFKTQFTQEIFKCAGYWTLDIGQTLLC